MDDSRDDESLMLALGRGELAALAGLVRRHQEWAWRVAVRFLGRAPEAEDVVQEAFLRLPDAAPRYQAKAPFRAYLRRIVVRLRLDHHRRPSSLPLEELPEPQDPAPSPPAVLLRREDAAILRAALDTLPATQRMALVLRYYEELDSRDIAAAMAISPKAVERLLARGRDGLRKVLAGSSSI